MYLKYGIILTIFFLQPISADNPKCNITIDITDGIRNGTSITKDGLNFSENDYFTDDNQVIWGCICQVKHCIRRCCSDDETLIHQANDTMVCSSTDSPVNTTEDLMAVVGENITLFNIISVPIREVCVGENEVQVQLPGGFNVDSSGDLTWDGGTIGFDKYCAAQYDGGAFAVVCVEPDSPVNALVYCLGMIISMPFLLVTFLVYFLLPDRNLHQKALMFYVLSLLVAYILLVTINLTSGTYDAPWCSIFGYTTIFSFMVSFFWMNVICFDIWYTFSGGRGFAGSKRTSERKRLIVYGIYAFGMPALLLLVIYALQRILPETSAHNPGIGITKCFLADGWPNLWYFYGEAGLLVLANIIFFVLTALKIRKVKQETSMLKHSDSKRHSYEKDKQKFNLYLKLLFAMGVNWSMEVISWMVNFLSDSNYQYIFYLTDFFNAVYGVWIFFIFVFKKKIWTLLKKRYYNLIGKPHLAHTVTSMQTRTSNYSSTNYSTADTQLTDRGSAANGRQVPSEEMALRQVT